MNLRRMLAVASKELREILRDRVFCLLTFLMPPMMMLVFGYGMSQDVEHVPFVIVDYDHTPFSRDYAYRYIASRYFRFQGYAISEQAAEQRMARGEIRFILILPDHFQERLSSGRSVAVQSLLDGTFTVPSLTIKSYVEAVGSEAGGEIQQEYAARYTGVPADRARNMAQPLTLQIRYLYNQDMRAIWTVAPMLVLIILIWTTPLLMSLSVVREKESGAIYNMYASTLSRWEYLIGKLLPNVGFSCLNAALLTCLAIFYYGAPFKGDVLAFALATVLYVIAISAYGLLISLMVRVQQAALIISIILAAIIMDQYSGMHTPVADMTGPNYVVAHLFPAMYYNDVVEMAFLKGGGFRELGTDILALAVYVLVVLHVVHALFRKRVRA